MTDDFEVTAVGAVREAYKKGRKEATDLNTLRVDTAHERGRVAGLREAVERCRVSMDEAKSHGAFPQVLGAKWCRDAILAIISDDTPAPRSGVHERAAATVFDPCAGSAGLLVGHDACESSGSPAAVSETGPLRAVDEVEALIDQLLKHVAPDDYIQGYKAACRAIRTALAGGAND